MTYAQIISYIERVATAHRAIRTTYIGDYEKISDLITKPGSYTLPAVWIETPEVRFVGSLDSIKDEWSISCVVLLQSRDGESTQRKYHTEIAYRIARSILFRIMHDTDEGLVRFSIVDKSLRPIDPYSADKLVGWRIDLDIRASVGAPCYDAAEWDETIGVNDEMAFTLAVTETGWTATRTDVMSGSGWTYQWIYRLANGSEITSSSTVLTVTSDAARIYVILRATNGDITRECSATDAGPSVPYLYNPYA